MSNPNPGQASLTPNVRIENPKARKLIGDVLGWAVVGLFALNIIDMNIAELDLAWLAIPLNGILAGFLALFQLLVTSPNVPSA